MSEGYRSVCSFFRRLERTPPGSIRGALEFVTVVPDSSRAGVELERTYYSQFGEVVVVEGYGEFVAIVRRRVLLPEVTHQIAD
ncbi:MULTISPECIES: hypothetical protein [Haloferacaceae]|uniref:Uncharacterized protein n=1 Tax=Halorubrum glutamatedens TaxID=2707018 RepID=A0ABD5QWQ9_9EURY|nr:hypothetical protein [Halobellus captivus]